jgi:DNA polymerase-1
MAKKAEGKKRLVLLDAHAIIHRAYHALPEFTSSKGEPTGALYGLSSMLIKIIGDLKPDYIAAAYDLPGKTFRHEAYEEYKAGRAKTDPALISQLKRSRDIFKGFNIPIYDHPGFEADDILGTVSEMMKKKLDAGEIEIVIASGDMDTLQLITDKKVQVYTLKKGINDTILYDEQAMKERFGFGPELLPDYKGLRGDPSDNIIGVKGIGEKTATDLITNFGTIEDIYKKVKKDPKALEKAGIKPRIIELLKTNEEEAEFSKTLATIRRDAPIDFKLPGKTWKESVNIEEARKVFHEFDFRTLLDRFTKVIGGTAAASETLSEPAGAALTLAPSHSESSSASSNSSPVSEEELKKVGIALWLLNSDITSPKLDDILDYAGTNDFSAAKKKILEDLKKNKLEKVYEDIELPLIPILDRAQKRGILIDVPYMEELSNKYHKVLDKISAEIYKMAGMEFNINSPKQLSDVLFDKMGLAVKGLKKTAGGARSTRESELEKLKGEHKIIEKILDYRELQKILSTYVDVIPKMVDSDNRLHTTLNQAGATTGRFSSNNPNLQNIPVRGDYAKEIRKAFIASPGHKWIACDYSQIEMRIMALFCEDENLINIFKSGLDVHSATASLVFGVPEDKVTGDMRRQAKVINFGIIYGMGVSALKANLGSTREEAQKFYDNYFKTFPKIREFFEKTKKEAKEKGYTETLYGRRRYFPGLKSKIPFIRAMAERMAINAPLQGTAADIIKIAMKEVDEELKEEKMENKAYLLLQVHDELIYEVENSSAEKALELVKRVMENAIEARLPFSVNAYVGPSWAELG